MGDGNLYCYEKEDVDFNNFKLKPYTIVKPQFQTPFIASFPHSGVYIPPFLKKLYTANHLTRLRHTDWYLPNVYNFLSDIGVVSIQANFSRYTADVNRCSSNGTLTGRYNQAVIYTHDTSHEPILKRSDSDLRSKQRVRDYYTPYHAALEKLICETRDRFGYAYLIDLHSFLTPLDEQLCLGSQDNYRTASTLHPTMQATLGEHFQHVAHNKVFKGGFITRKYGAMNNVEALQIELRYSEYLKNGTYEDCDRFPEIDQQKLISLQPKLKKALINTINAFH